MTLEIALITLSVSYLTHVLLSVLTAGSEVRAEKRAREEAEFSRQYWTKERFDAFMRSRE